MMSQSRDHELFSPARVRGTPELGVKQIPVGQGLFADLGQTSPLVTSILPGHLLVHRGSCLYLLPSNPKLQAMGAFHVPRGRAWVLPGSHVLLAAFSPLS